MHSGNGCFLLQKEINLTAEFSMKGGKVFWILGHYIENFINAPKGLMNIDCIVSIIFLAIYDKHINFVLINQHASICVSQKLSRSFPCLKIWYNFILNAIHRNYSMLLIALKTRMSYFSGGNYWAMNNECCSFFCRYVTIISNYLIIKGTLNYEEFVSLKVYFCGFFNDGFEDLLTKEKQLWLIRFINAPLMKLSK